MSNIKHFAVEGVTLHENNDGRWLCFRTSTGSQAAININEKFPTERVVDTVLREWAAEQNPLPEQNGMEGK